MLSLFLSPQKIDVGAIWAPFWVQNGTLNVEMGGAFYGLFFFLLLMLLGLIFEAISSVLGPKLDDFGKENEAMLAPACNKSGMTKCQHNM